MLKAEEESIKKMCDTIISFKPDVVITEKGLSDLAAHFFTKVGGCGRCGECGWKRSRGVERVEVSEREG